MKNLLTIAGSDSGGGAGIQADLKTFAAHGCYGMSVITAVTAQNTKEVLSVQGIDPKIVGDQLDAVFSDIRVDAVKIGMLYSKEIVCVVAEKMEKYAPRFIVLDPVMVSTSGSRLIDEGAQELMCERLMPLCSIVTPNIPEAKAITGNDIFDVDDMRKAACRIMGMGANAVLLKGGHMNGSVVADLLVSFEAEQKYIGTIINSETTHGTGCTLSSAIAANLANDMPLPRAVGSAWEYVRTGIEYGFNIGSGHGPTNHFYNLWRKAGFINGD